MCDGDVVMCDVMCDGDGDVVMCEMVIFRWFLTTSTMEPMEAWWV